MSKAVAKTMGYLNQLIDDVFACLLDPNYPQFIYTFERRLHKQKNQYLASMQLITHAHAREKCAHVFEVVMDLAAIRRRVSDHSTFSIVSSELGNILSALDANVKQIQKHVLGKKIILLDEDWLAQAISNFEDMYFSIVNVAAPEPLVFLLFIDGLKTLAEWLKDCQTIMDDSAV